MTTLVVLAAGLPALVVLGWWVCWLDRRLHRAQTRAERSWAVLDAALVRRAERAATVARGREVDLASALLVGDAAAAALEPGLPRPLRERAESTLSHVLDLVALPGVVQEQDRLELARRLHNDAVSTARTLRRRPAVRLLRLAGGLEEPAPFEMADGRELVWWGGEER
jgi:hypothetical protein